MNSEEAKRPFYFMVPFWGRRYREYFVDLCLPSLLAPNNLELLRAEDGHRFLMATTREDWEAIEHLPIMERLRQHATPTWIEVDKPQQNQTSVNGEAYAQYASSIDHQNLCQKKLVEAAYRDRPYGCMLCPDFILSDNMVATLLLYAQEGYHLVLCPALRQTEEAVLDDLLRRGVLTEGKRFSLTGQELTISPRVTADLFVRHLHPEMRSFEYGSPIPNHPFVSPFRFWYIPGGRGMVLHTFFGLPLLMDFAVVPANHAECLDRDILENVYFSENFSKSERIRIIQDSDEFCVVSLTPAATNCSSSQMTEPNRLGWKHKYDQLCNMRESMWYYSGRNRDVMRRDLFRLPIRWHTADLDDVWAAEEQKIDQLINRAVGDYYSVSTPPYTNRFPSELKLRLDPQLLISKAIRWVLFSMPVMLATWSRLFKGVIVIIRVMIRRIGLALCGDRIALRWWGWRLRKLKARLVGQPFQESRPPAP